MNPFKGRKEKKEKKKQEELEELMNQYNLEDLSQEDKEYAKMIVKGMSGTMGIGLTSKSEDMAKIGLLRNITDQNFLIIKLLNEINNKLDE